MGSTVEFWVILTYAGGFRQDPVTHPNNRTAVLLTRPNRTAVLSFLSEQGATVKEEDSSAINIIAHSEYRTYVASYVVIDVPALPRPA